MHTYKAKTNCKDLKVILCDEKVQKVYSHREIKGRKLCPLIYAMKASVLIIEISAAYSSVVYVALNIHCVQRNYIHLETVR